MHRNYRHAYIYRIYIEFVYIFGDRTATACVNFAEFRHLPVYLRFFEYAPYVAYEFRTRVARTALAARARKFAKSRSAGNYA